MERAAVVTEERRPERDLPLDGLRGIAIILVLIAHIAAVTVPPGDLRSFLGTHGAYGVDLFFVISGYIITTLLLQRKGQPNYFESFYLRRCQRILPLYFAFLAAYFLVTYWRFVPPPSALGSLLLYPFFVQNALPAFGLPFLFPANITWSLCVEEHFYLVWPLLVARLSAGGLRAICLGAVALSFATRYICWANGWYDAGTFITPAKLDGLALGALVALGWSPFGRSGIAALTGASVAALLMYAGQINIFAGIASSKLVFSLLFFLLVAFRGSLKVVLSGRPLVYIGQRSYGIYLIHALVFFVVENKLSLPSWGFIPTVLGLSFFLAELSWRYLEQPILNMRFGLPSKQTVVDRSPGLLPLEDARLVLRVADEKQG